MKRNLIIYHEDLLTYSETFILGQAESLRRFTPYYAGLRRVGELETPPGRTIVVSDGTPRGRAGELLYKATGFAPRLVSRLRALRPVLMHAHFGTNGAMALPLARRLRVPLVVTFHGRDATVHDDHLRGGTLRERRLVTRRPELIRQGALFIAVSEHIRRRLLDRGFPPEKVVTHYNGIDTTFFTPRGGSPAAEPAVLFVGRFVEKKGAAGLLRAMAEVQRAVPGARLVLIGDGPLRATLEEQARALGVRCAFLGKLSAESVLDQMRAAQVFCLPSLTASNGDTEGLPTVVLEALAAGVPTVSTLSAGTPEAVTDGETGLLVPERDEGALAAALIRLLRDAPLRERLARAGRRVVVERFDAAAQARALETLYDRVAEQALSGPGRRGVPAVKGPGNA